MKSFKNSVYIPIEVKDKPKTSKQPQSRTYSNPKEIYYFLAQLQQSYENKVMLLIEYMNSKNRLTTRFVEFYSVKKTKYGNWLMYGFSHNAGGKLKAYRIDRIISITPTILTFKPQWEQSLDVQ